MPLLKHAKKKLKQDKKRTLQNRKIKDVFKKLVKIAKEAKTPESVSKAFSAIDKAAKQNILPKNRASRMKSSVSRIAEGKLVVAVVKKAAPKKKGAKKLIKSKASIAAKSRKK